MLTMFKIDDGATHTVIANDEAEAYGIYVEHAIRSGTDWPEDKPLISKMDEHRDYTLHPSGGELKLTMPVYEWRNLFGKPQYVGCSEF